MSTPSKLKQIHTKRIPLARMTTDRKAKKPGRKAQQEATQYNLQQPM
jgi:hypothetical protein